MKELIIYDFRAKNIEDCLRIVANTLNSYEKKTCLDRDVMQCWETIKNVLQSKPDEIVKR